MAAENKLGEVQAGVLFRQQVGELIDIAKAVCKPGQSVEDLVQVLEVAQSNDMLLGMLMEKVSQMEMGKPL